MHISTNGLHLIEQFEGWSSCPYWDPYGRVYTRGFGETEGITANSRCISRAEGEANLKRLVEERYEWALNELGVPLGQNQWDALCSFVWNLGAGIFKGTNVGAALRKKEWGNAADCMLAYDHAGGQVLEGLRTRREQEVQLFLRRDSAPPTPPYFPEDERRWESEWIHLKGVRTWKAHQRRVALKRAMIERRKAIWHVATTQRHGWSIMNRYHRYMLLKEYTK